MCATMGTSRSTIDVRWIPCSVAAQLLQVSRQRVYQLIDAGALTSVVMSGRVLVGRQSVEARQATRGRVGGGLGDDR